MKNDSFVFDFFVNYSNQQTGFVLVGVVMQINPSAVRIISIFENVLVMYSHDFIDFIRQPLAYIMWKSAVLQLLNVLEWPLELCNCEHNSKLFAPPD